MTGDGDVRLVKSADGSNANPHRITTLPIERSVRPAEPRSYASREGPGLGVRIGPGSEYLKARQERTMVGVTSAASGLAGPMSGPGMDNTNYDLVHVLGVRASAA